MQAALKQSQTTVFMTALVVFISGFHTLCCQGQTIPELENTSQNPSNLLSRIRGETVQRQAELLRVDTTSAKLASRVSKLEGRLLSTVTCPTITTREAKAALNLARAQSHELHSQPGKPSEVQIAMEQLAISRAESQLVIALALQKENLLLCELDVIDAERELLRTSKILALQERLVARGLTPTEALAEDKLLVNIARKRLEVMRLRLETQQSLIETTDAKPDESNLTPTAASSNP